MFVFVHGIFSDSRSCWLYEKNGKQRYWPEMIRTDPRPNFSSVSLYLAGYYTAMDSGEYGIKNAADEILAALKRPDEQGRPPVMTKKNILFIGHSTGGVVIRYMLESNYPEFIDKTIGLVLVASPSYGSRIADYLDSLAVLYNQRLGQELKWRSWNLEDLDDRFKKLLSQHRIPRLSGIEGYENHFIVHHKWLPFWNSRYIVSKESAGRYFETRMLRDTDHFTTVKPNVRTHPGYEILYDFYNGEFSHLVMQPQKETVSKQMLRYEIHIYIHGKRMNEQFSNEPFEKRSSPVNVGCEQNGSTTVRFDLSPDLTVHSHTARWVDTDNIKSLSADSKVEGNTVVDV